MRPVARFRIPVTTHPSEVLDAHTPLVLPLAGIARTRDVPARGVGARSALEREEVPTRPLSPRQRDVLRLLAAGLEVKQIAAQLNMSYETTRNHLHMIYARLQAANGPHAVALAYGLGLLTGMPERLAERR